MPLKFTKDISTHLFKYVRNVDVTFNPFDIRTRSARELLRQVQAGRFSSANPNLKVKAHVVATPDPPSVVFKFVDGTEKVFDSQEFIVNEMMEKVFLHSMEINNDYEMNGKSIDDQ